MKTFKSLTILLLLFIIFSAAGIKAQKTQNEQKATLIIRSEKMVEVPSLASRMANGTFIQAENKEQEFNPKRWGKNTSVPGKGLPRGNDPLWEKQKQISRSPGRDLILTFEAASSGSNPTDPTGAVGPNHFLNSWNVAFRIWDKSGNPLTNAASLSNIFPGQTDGDPIVMYDRYADRFIITEFDYNNSPYGFLVAISQGPDPVNDGWYTYFFQTNTRPDYPKFSVWSDGYYITANKDQGSAGTSEVVFAIERDKIINGDQTALMVGFPLTDIVTSGFYSPLGFNCNGSTLPPAGDAPIVYMQDDSWSGVSSDHLKLWLINVDWTTPANSTISSPQIINTTPFDGLFDGGSFSNLPQPSGSDVDALQATIMYMAQYRRFSTYNSAIFNFVVDLDGNDDHAGIRWFELRQNNDGDPWTIYQEGTYSQPDGHSAFCGNMCMDASGNIAMAYTVVSSSQYPSLRYTGRYANDPTGNMTIAEGVIVNGTQSDPSSRYGDYAQMTIDPTDDATFWTIGEYFNGGTRKNQVGVFQIAPPELTAQFSADPQAVCIGGSVTFTDESLGSPTSWNWTFEGGTPSTYSGQTPPPVVYNTAGTYDVTLEVGDGNTTDILTIENYITAQNIIADFSGSPTTVIAGGSVTFSDMSSCDPDTWDWSFPGGDPSSYSGQTPPAVAYDTPGTYDVSLTVTNTDGSDTELKEDYINVINCSYCETSYSNQADDWISNVTFNTIDNSTDAEDGGYGDYTSLSTDVETGLTYTLSVEVTVNGNWVQHVWAWIDWNMNCDFTDEGEAYDLGQTPGTDGTHVLTIDIQAPDGLSPNTTTMRVAELFDNDPEPCTTATYGEAEDYSVNIVSGATPPVADFEADNLVPLVGETVAFTDLSANDPTSWSWTFTPSTVTFVEGTDENSQNPQVIFDQAGAYTVELTATNNDGSDTETKEDYINARDTLEVTAFADPDEICAGEAAQLNAEVTGGTGSYTFSWTSDPEGFGSTAQNPVVTPGQTTLYMVEVNDGEQTANGEVEVVVNQLPEINLGDWPEELCHNQEPPVQLTATPEGGIYSGDAVTPDGIFSPEEAPLGWNLIIYTYEDENGCVNSEADSIFVDDCTGMAEKKAGTLWVYPNPNSGQFTIVSDAVVEQVMMMHQSGAVIKSNNYHEKTVKISVDLPAGTYLMRVITTENKTGILKKIIIK